VKTQPLVFAFLHLPVFIIPFCPD